VALGDSVAVVAALEISVYEGFENLIAVIFHGDHPARRTDAAHCRPVGHRIIDQQFNGLPPGNKKPECIGTVFHAVTHDFVGIHFVEQQIFQVICLGHDAGGKIGSRVEGADGVLDVQLKIRRSGKDDRIAVPLHRDNLDIGFDAELPIRNILRKAQESQAHFVNRRDFRHRKPGFGGIGPAAGTECEHKRDY
jgi:hypothetical protein